MKEGLRQKPYRSETAYLVEHGVKELAIGMRYQYAILIPYIAFEILGEDYITLWRLQQCCKGRVLTKPPVRSVTIVRSGSSAKAEDTSYYVKTQRCGRLMHRLIAKWYHKSNMNHVPSAFCSMIA